MNTPEDMNIYYVRYERYSIDDEEDSDLRYDTSESIVVYHISAYFQFPLRVSCVMLYVV